MSHIPYTMPSFPDEEILKRSGDFLTSMQSRRSMRFFNDRPVQRQVIENLLLTSGTAPSGANKQPWFFCAISDQTIKREIREAAEAEERAFYGGRAGEEWLKDLEPFGTTWQKPYLETAPWLIAVFKKSYDDTPEGKTKNYYVQESVGIAVGFFIAAVHQAGLTCLTHTPNPMGFLTSILNRPLNEKPFLLLPVGHPAASATVPDIRRKSLDEIAKFY